MREPVWKEAAKMAVYWYVESQEVGSDSALIVIQAAFELLSWTWFVEDRKKYSRRDFNRLPTAVKLRLLLESAEIPTTIQSSLQELDAHAKSRGWADGPEALVGIRNALVHPTVRNVARIAATSAYSLFEASQLALWYLELILLYLFGFQGKYANRLVMNGWKGEEVSPVPWQSIPAA
jgi:hypothetical protein